MNHDQPIPGPTYVAAPPNDVLYVQMKLEWKTANPGATQQQYDAAIDLIKDICGI